MELVKRADSSFAIVPDKIYLYYERWQKAYESLPAKVVCIQGIPDYFPEENNQLIILDDLADLTDANSALFRLASVHARHSNTYLICVKHNLFGKGKHSRDLAVTTQYYVLFENARYHNQLSALARQLMPKNVNYFMDAYAKAVRHYGYLVVDLTPRTEDKLLSDILNDDGPAVYVKV